MQNNKVLCIGDVTVNTDQQCQSIAHEKNIDYKGIITVDSVISDAGCYHVSVGDVSDAYLLSIIKDFDEVIFLNNFVNETELATVTKTLENVITRADTELKTLDQNDLLCVGCAHTIGDGHSNKETTFAKRVASALSMPAIVNGKTNTGNYFIEDILAEYNLTNQNVIVQLTDIFSIRYFNLDTNEVVNKRGFHYNKIEKEVFDEQRLFWDFKKLVDRIVSRLRSANSNFLFFQLSLEHPMLSEAVCYMSKYKEFCFIPSDVYVDIAEDKIHHGPETHKKIAGLLEQKWRTLYA